MGCTGKKEGGRGGKTGRWIEGECGEGRTGASETDTE